MSLGRPKKSSEAKQTESLPLRVRPMEKAAFQQCAELAGVSLSTWVRERLRTTAIRELEVAGRRIPFVENIPIGGHNEQNQT